MGPNARQRPHPATTAKVQRWIDLVAGLLSRRTPATFEELAAMVPQYQEQLQAATRENDATRRRTRLASVKRTFERDKDELRRLGVLLQTLPDAEQGQDAATYRLRTTEFYLPYLCVAGPDGRRAPPRLDRHGYRALTALTFTPDELQVVVDAATVASTLGDPTLHREATNALRKLAVDLPVDAVRPRDDEPRQMLPRARADSATFDALGDAVRRRKATQFLYGAPAVGARTARRVDPWGLFFVGGHWYLAAYDRDRGARRNFRLTRMREVQVNEAAPLRPDFDVPADFDLRDLARARLAWELGEGDEAEAIVEVRGTTGAELAARNLGRPVEGCPERRALTVRRWDPLVRWILSFAGGVVPIAPDDLVHRWQAAVAAALTRYAEPPETLPALSPPAPVRVTTEWKPATAAEQWRRLLQVIPLLADGAPHPMSRVAAAAGTTEDVLRDDLHALVTRYDLPGGFVEGVQLYLDATDVSVVTNHFLRPMRVTASELCSLELGLAVLRHRHPPDEHPVLDRVRERLREVIVRLPDDAVAVQPDGVAIADTPRTAIVHVLRDGVRRQRKVLIRYRGSGRGVGTTRIVHPRSLVAAHGALYVVAWCEEAADMRTFRLDRIEDAQLLEMSFDVGAAFDAEEWFASGRVFHGEPVEVMRVWYSPAVAPWIAEREGRERSADGSLVLEHPVSDREWAVRHVLQYAEGAELLAPPGLRAEVRDRLAGLRRR